MKFERKVWRLVSKIPEGKVTTYKEIARALNTKAYRAVGNALNKNPHWPKVPCHRIIRSDRRVGGFYKGGYYKTFLLRKEGIKIENGIVESAEIITKENLG